MRITVMSRDVLESSIQQAVALDELMMLQLGRDFSESAWTEESFRHDLPYKWQLSRFAMFGERLAGYWIASSTVPGNCHTHRVAVRPEYAGQGIGRMMFRTIEEDISSSGFAVDNMTLEVGHSNLAAQAFYRKLGFQQLRESAISDYLRARKRKATVRGDHLEEADGSCFSVLEYKFR
jgi:ribosomal protein S18 acetylase RimI-like enzyme